MAKLLILCIGMLIYFNLPNDAITLVMQDFEYIGDIGMAVVFAYICRDWVTSLID